MNSVSLVGRLTKDIDLRFTQSGTAVGNFILAVNRPFKNEQGEREADFISCVVWRKAAENLSNFTRKGSQIGITGKLQTRNYEDKNGQRVYVTEVVVDNFDLLDPKEKTDNSQQNYQQQYQPNSQQQYQNNYQQSNQYQQPSRSYQQQPANQYQSNQNWERQGYQMPGGSPVPDSQPVEIGQDDLPF